MSKIIHVLKDSPQSYPIVIGNDNFQEIPTYLKTFNVGKKVLILTHPSLVSLYGESLHHILCKDMNAIIFTVPEGESSKSFSNVQGILDCLLDHHFERNDTLIALGGGVVGDLGGFAASIYLRGINFIQCPTTLLAQVDAAIGGKTGINHPKGKNLIGSFYQPRMTFINLSVLQTLPKFELLSGLAEVVKYGVIMNPELFSYLETNVTTFSSLSVSQETLSYWQHIVYESCNNKATVVSKDEKESSLRAILNYGHTIGHAIEAVAGYSTYSHGQAIAIGMNASLVISLDLNLISKIDASKIRTLLTNLGFELTVPALSRDALHNALRLDKKVKNGRIQFILATRIGEVIISTDVSEDILNHSLNEINI